MAYGNGIFLSRGPVTVRPLLESDAGVLLKWMTDPAVLEWYEGRDAVFTPERIQADFYDGEPLCRCIVEYQKRPVGYVQVYPLDGDGKKEYGYPDPDRRVFAMDQFLGEPDCWNKKIGRAFIGLLLEYLTKEEGAQSVVLDPHANNLRALRCYEACGFRKQKLLPAHELHEGVMEDCWLMEYRTQA